MNSIGGSKIQIRTDEGDEVTYALLTAIAGGEFRAILISEDLKEIVHVFAKSGEEYEKLLVERLANIGELIHVGGMLDEHIIWTHDILEKLTVGM